MANLRGLRAKTPVGMRTKQVTNMARAARLSPPKTSRRSHRLTARVSAVQRQDSPRGIEGHGCAGTCTSPCNARDNAGTGGPSRRLRSSGGSAGRRLPDARGRRGRQTSLFAAGRALTCEPSFLLLAPRGSGQRRTGVFLRRQPDIATTRAKGIQRLQPAEERRR